MAPTNSNPRALARPSASASIPIPNVANRDQSRPIRHDEHQSSFDIDMKMFYSIQAIYHRREFMKWHKTIPKHLPKRYYEISNFVHRSFDSGVPEIASNVPYVSHVQASSNEPDSGSFDEHIPQAPDNPNKDDDELQFCLEL